MKDAIGRIVGEIAERIVEKGAVAPRAGQQGAEKAIGAFVV